MTQRNGRIYREKTFTSANLFVRTAAFIVALSSVAFAAGAVGPDREAFTQLCLRQAKQITAAATKETGSREQWERVRDRRREELRRMLGLHPAPARTPLRAVITGKLEKSAYAIEKLAFQSFPDVYVSANLYLPKGEAKPRPAIVYGCGHTYSPFGAKVSYQKHAATLAKNGYVVLVVDPIQIAETYAWHHGPSGYGTFDWYSRGYTPAGAEVWNAIRAIDYLETRPEVDASRIGMTGRSGGAGASWLTAAVDDRVKVIVPGASIITYVSHLNDYTDLRKCDCMFFGNVYRHDMLHLGALVAPRPVYMIYGKDDPGFPSNYPSFEKQIGRLYAEYGKPEALRSLAEDAGHSGTDRQRSETVRFFDRFLMGIPERAIDTAVEEVDGRELLVFPNGAPADARNHLFHEMLPPAHASERPASAAEWLRRKATLLEKIRGDVLPGIPETASAASLPVDAQKGQGWIAANIERPDGSAMRALLFRPKDASKKRPALLYIASEGETQQSIGRTLTRVRQLDNGVVVIAFPSGVSETPWDEMFRRTAMRNAIAVGETIDSIRLRDAVHAARVVMNDRQVDPKRVVVFGRGASAGLAVYTAILIPQVWQVALMDMPASHKQSPVLLNILRYTDLPEAAALVLPRRVNFIGGIPESYALTKHIATLVGHPGQVSLAMSIEGLLEGRHNLGFPAGW